MAVLIGHASIDENNKIKGGTAGDQTGKEVCIRDWYNKNWNVLLRPLSHDIAEKSAIACEKACANSKIGYDQNQRNTLKTQASKVKFDLSKITTACECDCSSLMTVCAEASGVKIPYNSGNAPTTSTMRKAFTSTGMYTAITDSKYLSQSVYLKRGDILIKEGSHTVMVLSNGSKVSASISYYPKYTGSSTSIVEALKSVGEKDTSITNRKKIGIANNINDVGSAPGNLKMLNLLKAGELKKA